MTSGPSDYLAAERTFLAWIRTGLALMGFGFVVARFGLFLRMLQSGGQSNLPAESFGFSFWAGTALITLGVIVNIMSARHHARLIRELNAGGTAFNRPSSLGIVVAVILAVLGFAMAVYLISVRDPRRSGSASEFYSCRSAFTGSTRLARRAGTKLANNAAITSTGIMMAKLKGSVDCIPSTRRIRTRPAAQPPATPPPTPRKIIPKLCRITSPTTSRAVAPSAMRT